MSNFNGQLGSNEIYAAKFNMIISQNVEAKNIAGTFSTLVDKARVDGSLYGDRKLYYDTDVLPTYDWGADAEAANLLGLDRAKAPKTQVIILDKFRQIRLTTDEYLSKRMWMNEGDFARFDAVLMGWIKDTKRVYDSTLYNSFIGTDETTLGQQKIDITLPAIADGADNVETEAHNKLVAQAIATKVADIADLLADPSRDFNDYGHLKSFDMSDLVVIWNTEAANKIRHNDLPQIFHKDSATPLKFEEVRIPARYFGNIITTAGTSNGTQHTLVELHIADPEDPTKTRPIFPGDIIPTGTAYKAYEAYTVDSTILFKVMHKNSVPYMSAFEVSTSFFNPRSLTKNHYLTFGYNTLEHLSKYPMITVRTVASN